MDDLAKIINQRAVPGTLIFDLDNRLLFINHEARTSFLKKNRKSPRKFSFFVNGSKGRPSPDDLPEIPDQNGIILHNEKGFRYSARAFLISRRMSEGEVSHIMVLLERVAEKHSLELRRPD